MDDARAARVRRRRTPTVLQSESAECGAAALSIILKYYGRHVPLHVLRDECGISRDGAKAGNLLRAARKYGLVGDGYRVEPAALGRFFAPLIIFWDYNHYVVLEGLTATRAYINDPANGPVSMGIREFDKAFTGVVLSLRPGPEFKRGGRGAGLWDGLAPRLRTIRSSLVFVFLTGLALVLPGLAIPAFSRIFVDDVFIFQNTGWMKPLLLCMTMTLLICVALRWLQARGYSKADLKLTLTNSAAFMDHVLKLPYSYFVQRFYGEIASREQSIGVTSTLITLQLASAGVNLSTVLFFVLVMFVYDPLLTCIGIFFAGLNILVLRLVARRRTDLYGRLLSEQGKARAMGVFGMQNVETIKATGSEDEFLAQWAGHKIKAKNAEQRFSFWTNLVSPIPVFLSSLTTMAILGVGAVKVMDGGMTMGILVAFQGLMTAFLAPVGELTNVGARMQPLKGEMDRVDMVMRHDPDPMWTAAGEQGHFTLPSGAVRLTGDLTLRGVTFGYSRLEPPLIANFDLALPPGARVALVGGSGSGKSTLIRLVGGLITPWSGDILFDAMPREAIPREVLINSISFVDQDIFLFEGTVRENITMWNQAIPDEDMVQAAKDARIHDVIAHRPGGYESLVASGGANFSGGQRQRLEIARALCANPSILILDEATSALDAETEAIIDANLRRRGVTCLVATHRLSAIRDCDEILVLGRGGVVERGSHEELMARGGQYRTLLEK